MLTQAVILVGGLGTRLGERTRSVPKPLLEVAGKPFLDYILDDLSGYPTIQDILLLAGHQAGQVAIAIRASAGVPPQSLWCPNPCHAARPVR